MQLLGWQVHVIPAHPTGSAIDRSHDTSSFHIALRYKYPLPTSFQVMRPGGYSLDWESTIRSGACLIEPLGSAFLPSGGTPVRSVKTINPNGCG